MEKRPTLSDFLSEHCDIEEVVKISIEPEVVFFTEERDADYLSFDFVIQGLTQKNLILKFLKVAIYDDKGFLISYQYLNHNAVITPGIHTLGKYKVHGQETFDLYNPFFRFSKDLGISKLRYMFTFGDMESKKEYYFGNIIVTPHRYQQKVKLSIPMKGCLTVLDGFDFYSHHRRFATTAVRQYTNDRMQHNFSLFAIDLVCIGDDGNLQKKSNKGERKYDFHFTNAKDFYNDDTIVYSPAGGKIVAIENGLEDLYEKDFDFEDVVKNDRIHEIAGNYVVIQHNQNEFSHFFHLKCGSIIHKVGDIIQAGQEIARIGFSGAATTYSHLHYQLMDGLNFLTANALPCKFSEFTLLKGSDREFMQDAMVNTGDILFNE